MLAHHENDSVDKTQATAARKRICHKSVFLFAHHGNDSVNKTNTDHSSQEEDKVVRVFLFAHHKNDSVDKTNACRSSQEEDKVVRVCFSLLTMRMIV